ncbi:MAG: C39 family peptidase [Anaerolineae bacterium]|jgi:hypothetical protein|nr:C39 family peptidase [Anaerolineae bacterium]
MSTIQKAYYLRGIERVSPSISALVTSAQEAQIQHTLIQIADGDRPYPATDTLIKDAIKSLSAAGITVWGWAAAYGQGDPIAQAQRFTQRLKELGLNRGVIYTDHAASRWNRQNALRYVQTLEQAYSNRPPTFAISASPAHADFPLAEFSQVCAVLMPQIALNTANGDLALNLQNIHEAYSLNFPQKELIPVAVIAGEQAVGSQRAYWTARPYQIEEFLNACTTLKFSTAALWTWQELKDPLWTTAAHWTYQPPQTVTIAPTSAQTVSQSAALVTATHAASGNEVIVSVPYYSQEDATARYGRNDCGPACVRMVVGWDRIRKGQPDPANLTVDELTQASGIGQRGFAGVVALRNLAQQYGVSSMTTDGKTNRLTLDRLETEIRAGRPAICLVLYAKLTQRQNQRFAGGHFVVAVGFNDREIILNDPDWYGDRRNEGHQWRVPRAEFEAALSTTSEWFSVPYQGVLFT